MKQFIIFALIMLTNILLVESVNGQTLKPYVFPTNGGFATSPNISVSYTIGEPVTPTLQNATMKLTQGFQQPEIQVRTGTISGPLCLGSSLNVSYTAYGIFSSSNTFTAQLSNSSGSFSTPINIGSVTGNSSGTIVAVVPTSIPTGSNYRIRVVSSTPLFVGPDNGSNISLINTCSNTINVKLFIEGYYEGAGLMKPVRMNEGVGTSAVNVDYINVELHSIAFPYSTLASTTVFLQTNGQATATFNSVNPGQYYLVVTHRNAIETWSANPINLISSTFNYDFSTSNNKAYGQNMVEVEPGIWAFYSGDVTSDENIDLLDLSILELDINDFAFGYLETDINGDGNVDLLDYPILESNVNNFIFSNHP